MERMLSKITFVYQVMGLQYFDVNAESLGRSRRVSRKHKFFLLFNFTFVLGEIVLVLLLIFSDKKKSKGSGVRIGVIVSFIAYNSIIFLNVLAIVVYLLLRAKVKQIFKNCFRISELLLHVNQTADYSTFKSEFSGTMARLSFGFVASTVACAVFVSQYHEVKIILSVISAIYPYFFITVLVSYWTFFVRLIGTNLRFIKECIGKVYKEHKLVNCHSETYKRTLSIGKLQETYRVIVQLKRMYALVNDSTTLVNELNALPICMFMMFVILSNISGGYKIFLACQGDISSARIAGTDTSLNETIPLCCQCHLFQFQYARCIHVLSF